MGRNESPISTRVQALLDEKGLSASRLAGLVGRTQPYMSRRMRGAVAWRADDLTDIAAALDVPVSELLAAGERVA